MPVPSSAIATMNQILAGHFGPNRSSVAPDAYVVRLWKDDPRTDSPIEADWGGYPVDGVEWSSDDWLTPEGGQVSSDGFADFGAPSSAGTDAARFWGLHDTVTDDLCYSAPLSAPLSVLAEAEDTIKIRLTVPYGGRN
jgi:hypothetical protein